MRACFRFQSCRAELQVTAAIKEGFSGSYQISFCVIEAIAGASEITKPVIE